MRSSLSGFMNELIGNYGDVQITVSDDNARMPIVRSNMIVYQVAGNACPQRPNRWGNASPAAGSPRTTHSFDHEDFQGPPLLELGPCRWECLSPGGQSDISSPRRPSRKKAVKSIPPMSPGGQSDISSPRRTSRKKAAKSISPMSSGVQSDISSPIPSSRKKAVKLIAPKDTSPLKLKRGTIPPSRKKAVNLISPMSPGGQSDISSPIPPYRKKAVKLISPKDTCLLKLKRGMQQLPESLRDLPYQGIM